MDIGLTEAISGGTTCSATYAVRIEEGYEAVPSEGVTTFTPASNFTMTVYLSVYRLDEKGEQVILATDVPSQGECAVIITSGGGVVDAKKKKYPWVDLNGTNHFSNKVGKSVKGCQAEFLMGCMENQLSKLGGDVTALQKQFTGRKGEEEEIAVMAEVVNKMKKTVEYLKKSA